jgi:hypothetical protein
VDIISIVQAVLRRWYVSVPVVLVAAAGAFAIQTTTPSAYEATGQILLINPELDPSGLPITDVDLNEFVRLLDSETVREAVTVGEADYLARLDDQGAFVLTTTAPNRQDAEATVALVDEWARERVDELQREDVPDGERIQLRGGASATTVRDDQTDEYISTAVFSLTDPTASSVNPLAASNATVRLLIVAVDNDAGRAELRARYGLAADYELTQSARDAAPIMGIVVTGTEPRTVLDAFETVRSEIAVELDSRQDRALVPQARRTRVETLAAPQTVRDISPPVSRAAAAVLGLGGLMAIALAIAIDGVAMRRRRRKKDTAQTGVWLGGGAADPDETFEGVISDLRRGSFEEWPAITERERE